MCKLTPFKANSYWVRKITDVKKGVIAITQHWSAAKNHVHPPLRFNIMMKRRKKAQLTKTFHLIAF